MGELVAIEVAEVVCEDTARINAQGEDVYRNWKPGELKAHILRLLSEKDGKNFHGGPYLAIIACLFTDEPMLTFNKAQLELEEQLFGSFKQLTAAFLLFSYEPTSQSYPVFELKFKNEP